MKKIAFLQSGKALAVEPVQSTANPQSGLPHGAVFSR